MVDTVGSYGETTGVHVFSHGQPGLQNFKGVKYVYIKYFDQLYQMNYSLYNDINY